MKMKNTLKVVRNELKGDMCLDSLSTSQIIGRDASEAIVRNVPKFHDITEPKNKKGNMWNFGIMWHRMEKYTR